jgi:hypothetical protein
MRKILVLDANLIVLLIVGLADEAEVAKHDRTRANSIRDFRLLNQIISNCEQVRVIPNALTEASNLLRSKRRVPRKNL